MKRDNSRDESVARQKEAFLNKVLGSALGAFEVFTIYIGARLGLYDPLAQGDWLTPGQLAAVCGVHERYGREWLEQQTMAGILEVEDASAAPEQRRFRLPPGHTEVLTDIDSLDYLTPLVRQLVAATIPLEELLAAFQSGSGVPYESYGQDFRQAQADINRATLLGELGNIWLPSLKDLHTRLMADPPARVADIGCGAGWSSVAMAGAYPKLSVDGFDLDAPSVEMARENARQAGLSDRLNFQVRDAGDASLAGDYDLVVAIECIHDLSDPVAVLKAMLKLIKDDGFVLVADMRVAEAFSDQGDEVERIMYGWSVLACLPAGMADTPSAMTGTVMRPATLERYAQEAGFKGIEILDIDNFFWRFYRLRQN